MITGLFLLIAIALSLGGAALTAYFQIDTVERWNMRLWIKGLFVQPRHNVTCTTCTFNHLDDCTSHKLIVIRPISGRRSEYFARKNELNNNGICPYWCDNPEGKSVIEESYSSK